MCSIPFGTKTNADFELVAHLRGDGAVKMDGLKDWRTPGVATGAEP